MKKLFAFIVSLLSFHLYTAAQIPVSKEPRHHNVFENKYVRVLDVHLQPGDTSLFHVHKTASVFITLSHVKSGSEVRSQDPNDNKIIGDTDVYFTGFYHQPRIHRVWNSDTAEFHVMDVEILNKNPGKIEVPLTQAGMRLLFDEQPVRGYMLSINPGSDFNIKERKAPLLIVGLTDTEAIVNQKLFHKKGDLLFIPANHPITIAIKNTLPARFAVLEFK